MGMVVTSEIKELEKPSNSLSSIEWIGDIRREHLEANQLFMKQCIKPESTNAKKSKEELEIKGDINNIWKELGLERADILSLYSIVVQEGTMQSLACADIKGLHSIFLNSLQSLAQR